MVFELGEIRTDAINSISVLLAPLLVLQTILPPLSLAGSASTIIISGGTRSWSPSYHYLKLATDDAKRWF
jgi:RNA 3'-terminal phosphate cyclase